MELRPDLEAPALARAYVRASCADAADPDGVALAASDLVTDAVRRSPPDGRIRLAVLREPGKLVVRVVPGPRPGTDAPRAALAVCEAWGVDDSEGGRTVWCRFDALG